jgi:hypothetical protein
MADPWAQYADADGAAPAVAGADHAVAPVEVVAPSLKYAPVTTAGGDTPHDQWAQFSDDYNQAAPSAADHKDEALGFITHMDHAIQRMNAANPVRAGLNLVFPGQFPARDQSSPVRALAAQATAEGKQPGLMGSVAGDALGSSPVLALPGGPFAQGALSGLVTGHAKTPVGLAIDAGAGAVAGKLGDTVANGVLNTIAPKITPEIQMLVDRKVPVTTGMIAGNKGFWGRLEQVGQNVPVAGELIRKRGNEALVGFNHAVANEALTPIGASLPTASTGSDLYQSAQRAVSDAYDRVGEGATVPLDDGYAAAMQPVREAVSELPPDLQLRFGRVVNREVAGRTSPELDGMTADGVKDAKAALNKEIRKWQGSNGWEADYLDALKGTRRAVVDALGRTSPEAGAQLAAADAAYPGFKVYEGAVVNSTKNSTTPNGWFTPQQLQSSINSGATASQRAGATATMQDLAEAGKSILPSGFKKVVSPMQAAIEAGVGAGVVGSDLLGGHGVGMAMAVPSAALTPLYSKPGQDALRAMLLATARGRTAAERAIGPLQQYATPLGTNFGALLSSRANLSGLPLLPSAAPVSAQ